MEDEKAFYNFRPQEVMMRPCLWAHIVLSGECRDLRREPRGREQGHRRARLGKLLSETQLSFVVHGDSPQGEHGRREARNRVLRERMGSE